MGLAPRNPDGGLVDLVARLDRRVEALERMPSGTNSIGVDKLRPCVKAGAPADSDFVKVPPIGTAVYDTTNSKWWARHAAGVWKGVVLT